MPCIWGECQYQYTHSRDVKERPQYCQFSAPALLYDTFFISWVTCDLPAVCDLKEKMNCTCTFCVQLLSNIATTSDNDLCFQCPEYKCVWTEGSPQE